MRTKLSFNLFGIIVLVFMFGMNATISAFMYTINFTGSGASSTVESVIVQNLTKNTTVTVPAGAALILTDVITSIDKLNSTSSLINVYPNPINDKATLSFYAANAGNTAINVYGIDGKKVAELNLTIAKGENLFQLNLPKGVFILQVEGIGFSYNAKAISQSTTISQARITFDGKLTNSKPQKTKAASASIEMRYSNGDQLLYKGISGSYTTIVTDKPTGDKTTNFDFVECKDADNNNYTIVKIGSQIWMAENLKTTKYRNGDAISTATGVIPNDANSNYQWAYNDDESNVTTYGRLYTWWAATDTRNIAPLGWHVATEVEWTTLLTYLMANGFNYDGTTNGNNVAKALAASTIWHTYTGLGTIGNDLTKNNSSGFTALPGGYRDYSDGGFYSIGTDGWDGCWWGSTEFNTSSGTNGNLNFNFSGLNIYHTLKSYGFSVRCVKDLPMTEQLNITMVSIPAGMFIMGSPISEVGRSSDETQFAVTLSAFRMSKYEITNTQYAIFLNAKGIGSNGKYATGAFPTQALIYAHSSYGLTYTNSQWVPVTGYENMPVIFVTWYGATEFATYVGGSLPTEAQWEYACRAGTTTPFSTGNFLTNLQANYNWEYPYNVGTKTVTTYPGKTQAVGSYSANAFGLYDMHGNVLEWCADWYGTYPTTAQTNPTGVATGSSRVMRGGSWGYSAQSCRSAYRNYRYPSTYTYFFGFRVVLVP